MGEISRLYAKTPVVQKSNSVLRIQRTKSSQPIKTPADRILFLQRTIGNQAVQRLIKSGTLQAKLKISQPGYRYEQEADRVADAVMRMPEPGVQRQVESEEEEEKTLQSKPLANQITPLVQVQRQEEPEEEEETLLAKPLAEEITQLVQRQVEEEEKDLEVILGPPLENQSLNPDPETWRELYLYMKRLRRALSRSDPYFEEDMKGLLDRYFPGSGDKVWEDSRRPLAGYVGTRKGARRRMEMGKKLGLEETGKRRWKKKFMGSDVVFISGHHYGEGDLGSLDISKIRFRASRVKLVMVSSCSVLAPSSLRIWMRRFPNAYIMGWRSGSPYRQSNMMAKFLSKLPDDFLMEERSDMEEILAKWRSFVENLKEGGVRLRSEEGDPRSPWGVGYVTPGGRVTYYTRIKGKWRWVNR